MLLKNRTKMKESTSSDSLKRKKSEASTEANASNGFNPSERRKRRKVGSLTEEKEKEMVKAVRKEVGRIEVEKVSTEVVASNWDELGIPQRCLGQLNKMNFTAPTVIQAKTIGVLTEKTYPDVLIQAATGSGKTLAYCIPLALKLQNITITRDEGTYALIIVPTRELCQQVFAVCKELLSAWYWMIVGQLMGGEKKKNEKRRLKKGLTVVIATPGRLLDHLQNTGSFRVHNVSYLVLDEADRLLDMGFEAKVKEVVDILDKLKAESVKRQTTLCSATLSGRVENLVKFVLSSDARRIGLREKSDEKQAKFSIPTSVEHFYVEVDRRVKLPTILAVLNKLVHKKVLVFFSTCDEVEYFYTLVKDLHFPDDPHGEKTDPLNNDPITATPVFELRGSMPQADRTEVYLKFAKAKSGVLFCTDVAARGLDMPSIDWVVQYDCPVDAQEYIHRVGRCGRLGGRNGKGLIFCDRAEVAFIKLLLSFKIDLKHIKADAYLDEMRSRYALLLPSKVRQQFKHRISKTWNAYIPNLTENNPILLALARGAFTSFVRSYATYPRKMKKIFHIKNLHFGKVALSFGLKDIPGGGPPKKPNDYSTQTNTVTTYATLKDDHMDEFR